MVSQGTSSWMNNSQVCCFAGPNWLILQSDECQSWCKESRWGEECAVQTGVRRRAWRGSRMEENRLSPPVAASSFWFSSSLAKPLLTRERDQITAVSGQLSHFYSCRGKASEGSHGKLISPGHHGEDSKRTAREVWAWKPHYSGENKGKILQQQLIL